MDQREARKREIRTIERNSGRARISIPKHGRLFGGTLVLQPERQGRFPATRFYASINLTHAI